MDENQIQEAISLMFGVVHAQELGRFHEGVGVKNANCLRCDNPTWKLLGTQEFPMGTIPLATAENSPSQELGTPAITLACKNCGTIWLTSFEVFARWTIANDPRIAE